jgi:uncharacterized protein (TIGR03086 family)
VDLIDLHRRAAAHTRAIIDRVPGDHLEAQTPCVKWTIRDVIAHMVDNHRSLVTRAGKSAVDSTDFGPASTAFNEAFADPEVQAKPFELHGVPVDGRGVVAVQFADVLVHGWDIGRTAGLDVTLPDDLATAALFVTKRFPDNLRGPDGLFDHPRAVPDDAPAGVRLLAFSGRDPQWTAA